MIRCAILGAILIWPDAPVRGQEGATPPHWIWYPEPTPGPIPAETRYFRKSFSVKQPSRLTLDVTADNAFLLYLDGEEVARGDDWHRAQRVESRLATGPHVLAAEASNREPGAAGFLLRGSILPPGQRAPIRTDATWKVARTVPTGLDWTRVGFDDSGWRRAADLGPLGTGPWTGIVFGPGHSAARLQVPEGFQVELVAAPDVTGSVISFAFDPKGRPCVGIELGPIARLLDPDGDGTYDDTRVIAPGIKNCQGFAFIRGALYAVGNGPQRTGLHRLEDKDGDEVYETVELVRATRGGMGEHGPHAVALGPDGRLYFNNGNHAHLEPPIDPDSPLNIVYEGELLPHFNDPRGHAAGIPAPGGEIYRSDDDGKTWERIAGGFRNAYDFAFNRDGELFSFDSDMEWDLGLPWYRPVRITHCPLGAEFGWRNGSGKWPVDYFDSVPGIYDVGRGSPTGVTFYQGRRFPQEFDDNFLICDWSQGRILAVALTRAGASYRAKARALVTGQPLNCTDIEVGPDGAVYFTTGGRGTQGGLFRISWTRPLPTPGPRGDFQAALGADSPLSSFTQERIRAIQARMGPEWDRCLQEEVREGVPGKPRGRALDLMAQFGPPPREDLLIALAAQADQPEVRAKAVALLGGCHSGPAREALAAALEDEDPFVRRHACEGLMQQPPDTIPVPRLLPLLADPDRGIRFAARVAIEHAGPARFRERILAVSEPRPLIEGMLALIRAGQVDRVRQDDLFARQAALLRSPLETADRLDLLRLIALTYLLGPRKAEAPASTEFRPLLLALFPTRDLPLDRELARLLAFLDEPRAIDPLLKAQDPRDHAMFIHDLDCLRAIRTGWTPDQKQQVWERFETAGRWEGGYSFLGYLDMMTQEVIHRLTPEERVERLRQGTRFPSPTRVLVRSLDLDTHPELADVLASLYLQRDESANRPALVDLRAAIVEKLGRSRLDRAHRALRDLARTEAAHRDQVVRALADHPTAEDLPLLVEALGGRDLNTANTAVRALLQTQAVPEGPEALRNLIRLARRTGPAMKDALNELASRWTGQDHPTRQGDFTAQLHAWERVFAERFSEAAALDGDEPAGAASSTYTYEELAQNILKSGRMRTASPERGRLVIAKARCLECHTFGDQGTGLGPDLTTVSSRFRFEDLLDAIVTPSKVISDQYKPLTVATSDGRVYHGMPIVADGPNLVLLLPDGTKATLPKDDVEEQTESKVSVMPEGLLNGLTYQEIADLLALFNAMPRVAVPGRIGQEHSR